MRDLFEGVLRTAELSDCGLYRYHLARVWSNAGPSVCFIMLNPSTADAEQDDPTVTRCIGFARAWGCGVLWVRNLYAFRATSPRDLFRAANPAGPEADGWIRGASNANLIVAAWGANAPAEREQQALELLRGVPLYCLGLTKGGKPKHPLYCRANLTPIVFRDAKITNEVANG